MYYNLHVGLSVVEYDVQKQKKKCTVRENNVKIMQ